MTKFFKLFYSLALMMAVCSCSTNESFEYENVKTPNENVKTQKLIFSNSNEVSSILSRTLTPLERESWMSRLYPETRLIDITIPGTHDSPAFGVNVFGNTQDKGILEQLNAGIRYFDLRFVYDNGDLKAYHGSINLNQNFDQIINTMNMFLKKNPKEVVIIQVKKEDAVDNKALWVKAYEEKLTKYYNLQVINKYWSPKDKISKYYGKILPITRETGTTIYYQNWGGGSDDYNINLSYDNTQGFVQDNYYLATLFNIDFKKDKVKNAIYNAHKYSNRDKCIINFLSANGGATPVAIADRVNPETYNYILQKTITPYGTNNPLTYGMMRRSGWIIMDFANTSLGQQLVDICINQSVIANDGTVNPSATTGYLPI